MDQVGSESAAPATDETSIGPNSNMIDSQGVANSAVTEPTTALLDEDVEVEGDSDSDEDDLPISSQAKDSAERRRAQNAAFNSWVAQKAEQVTETEVKEALKTTNDEVLSVRNMLAKQETSVISSPREYQMELFERAKEDNVIAVLDTGSGKTLIAVLLLRHILEKEVEDRAAGLPPRISFFLVDSVTLVFQQFAVLETNLDYKVDRFCGAMKCELWSKQTWEKHFEENMVIVCTADVLGQCLMHSFININQINLLIFDEAHHAKKGHSYAKIIKDHYAPMDANSRRPKIFGMTASPVDAKVDVGQAAMELERLLHARIATTANLDLLRKTVSKPEEVVVRYAPLRKPFETPLCERLQEKLGDNPAFRSLFESARTASSELGAWCADLYWSFALTDEEARKLESKREQAFHKDKKRKTVSGLDAEIAQLREAAEIVHNHQFESPKAELSHLSSKVMELHTWLKRQFERPTESRAIVFVQRRQTARLLHALFCRIGGPYLRAGVITGNTAKTGDLNISFRKQVMTMIDFRKGKLNCLFATSVAEEGLDIPDCNLAIRFDLYFTMIQYVQSRGRARHKNSKYVHMIEDKNGVHEQTVLQARKAERLMRKFCESMPEDRLLQGNDADLQSISLTGKGFRTYTDPVSKAKLTYNDALVVLSHFCAVLPRHSEVVADPLYIMGSSGGKFICEVVLPSQAPITSVMGRPSNKKAIAKRSAAFEACLQLRQQEFLDENLLPIYTKQLPALRNAKLALNCKKTNSYEMMTKPVFWSDLRGTEPEELHVTIIDLPDGLDRPHQPLAILTRKPLPAIPSFPIFLNSGKKSRVELKPQSTKLRCSREELFKLSSYTFRIFFDIYNKRYEEDIANLSYWLAPVKPSYIVMNEGDDVHEHLDWPALDIVRDTEEFKGWRFKRGEFPDEFLLNKYFVDQFDGGRRFYSERINPDLKPTDPVPDDAIRAKKPEQRTDILNYSISLYKMSRQKQDPIWDRQQPVVEARQVLHRRNMLAEADRKELDLRTKVYLCAEPLRISALTPEAVTTAYVFPAIIHRLDEYLIALETCQLLDIDVRPDLALEAVTKDSDNTEDHSGEVINFRRGMGNNYERLEFMGDCFLKMAASIALFGQCPDDNEFFCHCNRMDMVCNQTLFDTAKTIELPKYVRSMAFNRRTWYPEGLTLLEGKANKAEGKMRHSLGDKSVADVCEALIGAAYITHNKQGVWEPSLWDDAVKAVSRLVCRPLHTMEAWSDYITVYQRPPYLNGQSPAAEIELARKVALEHPYQFRSKKLLRSAFCHPSYPLSWAKVPSYQRLEFLGDSLLDMVCVNYLFYRFPHKDPQWMTEHKMAMVSNKFLGALCVKIGFHKHLMYNHAQIESQIRDYAIEITEAEAESKGARDYWASVKESPKCLPDIVEAYVGAMFVDSNYDYGEVMRFFDLHIRWFFEDMSIYDTYAQSHPTTRLHTRLSEELGCANYRILAREMESVIPGAPANCIAGVMVHNQVIAEGMAASGKNAKVNASKAALEKLSGLVPHEFRGLYGCNCRVEVQSEGQEGIAESVNSDGQALAPSQGVREVAGDVPQVEMATDGEAMAQITDSLI
ncbi:dicer-like protein 1 [Phyllosticta capitalensis]|uniref:Dicer-like protein 1 n=1 Tax=Phyllosticta capitalensis TaxID=121624 RepID=A0ABR1YRA2_9PEZI